MTNFAGQYHVLLKDMTDTQKQKADPAILALLASPRKEVVLEALDKLRESGNPLYLPRLLDLLLEHPSVEIPAAVLAMLAEVKYRETAHFLAEAIGQERFLPVRQQLVTCCWQNGLDYAPWFTLFLKLVLDAPFETAFEAFTVIENMDPLPPADLLQEGISTIREALPASTGPQTYLLSELLAILEA